MSINEKQISELETYFANKKFPASVNLDAGIIISDVPKFVTSHLAVLRNNPDKPIFDVFHQRLLQLKEKIS